MMHLSLAAEIAFWIFMFFVFVMSITTVVLLAGVVFGLTKLNDKIDQTLETARPLVEKTSTLLDTAQRVTMNTGEKVDSILTEGEELTGRLSRKVDHTASIVEKTVTTPLINISSVIAGVSKGFEVFNRATSNGNGSSDKANGNGLKS